MSRSSSVSDRILRPIRDRLGKGYTASSSSIDSSAIQNCRYDVFISFRGPDTRNTFVDHLYAHLIRKGIFAFKDDKQLQQGNSISPQLLQAIQDSRVSIIVFSQNYASSTWCLDEMAVIAECYEQQKQTVFPVFCDVDPSHVRKQKGPYENAFVLHTEAEESIQGSGRVDRWKRAMTTMAGLVGWDVTNKPEFEEIEDIVQAVIKVLGHKFSGFAEDLIGIQPHVKELEELLKLSSMNDKFRVLGIRGMSGIGKTTLATGLYDRVSYQFEACCFIENVSKIYKDDGAIALQKQILRQTMDEKNLETYSPSEISGIVRNRLHNVKLLIVLDNVDNFEQLQELHIDPKLLCAGSRIIITTRDGHILRKYGADKVYEVQQMNAYDARKLLCRKAFQRDDSWNIFAELIPEVLNYAQGLPLAIRVMGSFLCTRDPTQWRATLDGLQNNPDKGIVKVLQKSFEGLQPREREVFLHVACFFKREREDYAKRILEACGLHPNIGIPLLIEKSLITIRNQEIHMHDMLQELGKQIVREQHPDEPEFWSRLWLYEDFHRVMMTGTGPTRVKAIVLDQKEDGFKFNKLNAEVLSYMTRLTLLILSHKNFSGRPITFSNCLRYLSWDGYPFTSLPSTFQPYDLVELNMPDSSIEQLWEGNALLPHLKRMDLSNSRNLKTTPNFEGTRNLERLDFTGCINLSQVHPSIGLLEKLLFLSLRNCCRLVSFELNSSVSRLRSLRVLHLSGCTKLENTPDLTGAESLEYLDMDQCTSLSTVHESIWSLEMLRFLTLRDCINLVELPFSSFRSLPLLSTLITLDLSFCNILKVPDAIGELMLLERLNLQGNNFVALPSTIGSLHGLTYLNLSYCRKLKDFPRIPLESIGSMVERRDFETTSESRDHRSGLYILDCPLLGNMFNNVFDATLLYREPLVCLLFRKWMWRLVKEPGHFQCDFDIVSPWNWEDDDYPGNHIIPEWFAHRFEGGSIVRTVLPDTAVDRVGFVFCVAFQVNNHSTISGSPHSSPLPHPFYLSFESEYTEERFDMPLDLDLDKSDGSKYLWIIYISRQHCHFVASRAQITFKARQGLIMKEWGLHILGKELTANRFVTNTELVRNYMKYDSIQQLNSEQFNSLGMTKVAWSEKIQSRHLPSLVIDFVEESNRSFVPKIQLPYNWLVSDEEEGKILHKKRKEIELSNLGF